MTAFLDSLQRQTNLTRTENGAVTNLSSTDPVVDFFSLAGAMRDTPAKAADLFEKAYTADPLTAVRTLFYLRDIRGGQGERDIFRACLRRLGTRIAVDDSTIASFKRLLTYIPEYGRWDDILFDGARGSAVDLIKVQLSQDTQSLIHNLPVSLMAKWLPSENASSPATKALASELREALGLSSRDYRKTLSALRARIKLLEHDMSTNNWEYLDYSKIPSQAHRRHVKAFERHTPGRYQAYLDSVTKGEAKINVSTVYPHEIYTMAKIPGNGYAQPAWDNLPDYTRGDQNALVMADVSGSMVKPYQPNNPIAVSVALAIYFAERNEGAFQHHFMSFSEQPRLIKLDPRFDLATKIRVVEQSQWSMNTDLSKAFRAILTAAVQSGEAPPSVLYIISDMEFDQATAKPVYGSYGQPFAQDTVFETAKREFDDYGRVLPHVVFWNVHARTTQAPALAQDGNVTLVSGLSPSVFAMAVEGKTPRQLVDDVVNSERYSRITL